MRLPHVIVSLLISLLCILNADCKTDRDQNQYVAIFSSESRVARSVITFPNASSGNFNVTISRRNPTPISYWYELEKSFMRFVQPADLNIEFGKEVYEQLIAQGFAVNKVFALLGRPELLGSVILVSIGIAYVVLVFFGGLIFCCCRCCCKERYQKYDKNGSTCKRSLMTMFLLLFAGIMGFGTSMLFISFKDLDGSLRSAPEFVNSTSANIDSVLDHTVTQALTLSKAAFQETSSAIMADLQSYKTLRGQDFPTALSQVLGHGDHPSEGNSFENVFYAVLKINGTFEDVLQHLNVLKPNLNNAHGQLASLTRDVLAAKVELDDFCHSANSAGLCNSAGIYPQQLVIADDVNFNPDFDMLIMEHTLGSLKQQITELGNDTLSQYYGIPKLIEDQIPSVRKELNDSLQTFEREMNFTEVQTEVSRIRYNIGRISSDIQRSISVINPYADYIWYGAVSLTTFYSVLLLLVFFGICGGASSYKSRILPTERSGCVVVSGALLMMFVYFTLLFSWIFMVVTTGIFLAGTVSDAAICPVILGKANNYSELDKVLEIFLPRAVPGNLSVSTMLNECSQDHATLYNVLNLADMYDLTTLNQELQALNIHKEVAKLSKNLANMDIFNSSIDDTILRLTQHLQNATFSTFDSATTAPRPVLNANITELIEKLQRNQASPSLLSDLRRVEEQLGSLNQLLANVTAEVRVFDTFRNSSLSRLNTTYYAATQAKHYFQYQVSNSNGSLNKILLTFADQQMAYGEQLVEYTIRTLTNDTGKCRPLYDIYENAAEFLCANAINPVNGIWFAWGLLLIISIPAMIMTTHLAKYYSRAKYTNVERKPQMFILKAGGRHKEHRV